MLKNANQGAATLQKENKMKKSKEAYEEIGYGVINRLGEEIGEEDFSLSFEFNGFSWHELMNCPNAEDTLDGYFKKLVRHATVRGVEAWEVKALRTLGKALFQGNN
jgi:hypothetical protein